MRTHGRSGDRPGEERPAATGAAPETREDGKDWRAHHGPDGETLWMEGWRHGRRFIVCQRYKTGRTYICWVVALVEDQPPGLRVIGEHIQLLESALHETDQLDPEDPALQERRNSAGLTVRAAGDCSLNCRSAQEMRDIFWYGSGEEE